jgi:hypothetical protein
MNFDIAYILIFVSGLFGLFNFFRTKELYLKIFPFFLLLSFVVETIGWQLSLKSISNILLYSIFNVFVLNFYMFTLYSIVQKPVAKKVISISMLVFTLFALTNFVFIQGWREYNSITYSVGSLFIVATCVYYFLELFQLPHVVYLTREPGFWITSGLLFFFACGFPILGSVTIMQNLPRVLVNNLSIILDVLNVSLYTLFILAFLCRSNIKKYMQ